MKNNKCFLCEECDKMYASYKSLWNHKKQFHDNSFSCIYCKIKINRIDNLKRHEKNCKNNTKIEELKLEEKILKLKIDLQNQKNNDLKKLKSFHELNQELKNRSYLINQQNSTNQIHSNNQINSNNTQQYITNFIIKFGDEEISSKLSIKEKEYLINSGFFSIQKMVELTNCGKYNEFKNIIITNMNNNIAYIYNDEKGFFEAENCNECLMKLLNNRIMTLEQTLEDVINSKNVSAKMKNSVTKFIDELQQDEDKESQKNKIKFILHNNTHKITNDLMTAIEPSRNEILENTIIDTSSV